MVSAFTCVHARRSPPPAFGGSALRTAPPRCAWLNPDSSSLQSALFDFTSLLTVILLMICTSAYLRAYSLKRDPQTGRETSWVDGTKHGFGGLPWKFARIGERLSPWVALSCVFMAMHILFVK